MLAKYSINQRLYALMAIMAIAILTVSALSVAGLRFSSNSLESLHNAVTSSEQVTLITNRVQDRFVGELNNLRAGVTTWVDTDARIKDYQGQFTNDLALLVQASQASQMNSDALQKSGEMVQAAIAEFIGLGSNQSRADLELFLLNDLQPLVNPFIQSAQDLSTSLAVSANQRFTSTQSSLTQIMLIAAAVILLALLGTLTLSLFISRSIQLPLQVLNRTVEAVKANNNDVRSNLKGQDELTALGNALDIMLDEKVQTMAILERENDAINNSIIELLEGASELSERDLNVELTVREDITGPVADSINLVTKEIRDALVNIRTVSEQVLTSSQSVKQQTQKVSAIAGRERQLVVQSFNKLNELSKAMVQIAQWCSQGNEMAATATESSGLAVDTVTQTIDSMDLIRDSISQAEKRIKRLSERSQEITSIVDIINNISERTHVLALNASMQAATAGEAGKGFAVVADEVQRLAESSHNSTAQIGVLIRNIQTETAEAVDVMNSSIDLVVDGSNKAESAGQQMLRFQQSINNLANSVKQISDSAEAQLEQAQAMKEQSMAIEKSTRLSEQELKHQAEHNLKLAEASAILLNTVNLFKLPAPEAKAAAAISDIHSAASQSNAANVVNG